jgi:hypothetical protein
LPEANSFTQMYQKVVIDYWQAKYTIGPGFGDEASAADTMIPSISTMKTEPKYAIRYIDCDETDGEDIFNIPSGDLVQCLATRYIDSDLLSHQASVKFVLRSLTMIFRIPGTPALHSGPLRWLLGG